MKRSLTSLAGLLLVSQAVAGTLLSPADAIAAAHADIVTLPADAQPFIRYLSVYNLPGDPFAEVNANAREVARALLPSGATLGSERDVAARVLSFHINSLSRKTNIIPPSWDNSHTALRIDMRLYGWSREVWERLLDIEPYFHARVEVPYGTKNPDGTWTKTDVRTEVALAPWLAKTPEQRKKLEQLVHLTQTQVPVVRGDWFLFQTAIQADRVAGYYDFLGVGKKQADFDKLVGFDPELEKQFDTELFGVVPRGSVTVNNRRLIRRGKIGGYIWVTLDAKNNVGTRNYLRVLDQGAESDATEQIAALPNELHAFWLANGKGERQDSAPDFVASDSTAPGTDRRVHAGLSCIRCHSEGIRPINDWVRKNITLPNQLQSPDFEQFFRLQQRYARDLSEKVGLDSAQYARAVARTNGLSLAANARAYAQFWERYAEADIGLDRASQDLGISQETIVSKLKEYASPPAPNRKSYGQIDTVLAGLMKDPALPIRIEQWEEVFPVMHLVLEGLPTVPTTTRTLIPVTR